MIPKRPFKKFLVEPSCRTLIGTIRTLLSHSVDGTQNPRRTKCTSTRRTLKSKLPAEWIRAASFQRTAMQHRTCSALCSCRVHMTTPPCAMCCQPEWTPYELLSPTLKLKPAPKRLPLPCQSPWIKRNSEKQLTTMMNGQRKNRRRSEGAPRVQFLLEMIAHLFCNLFWCGVMTIATHNKCVVFLSFCHMSCHATRDRLSHDFVM